MNELKVVCVRGKGLEELCQNNPMEGEHAPKYVKNFRYLCEADYVEGYDDDFIVGIKDGIVVGVLKLGTKRLPKSKFRYISFVDVHEQYRRQGIATELHKHIESLLDNDKKVVGSPLTKQGKAAKLNKLLKLYVTSVPTSVMRNF